MIGMVLMKVRLLQILQDSTSSIGGRGRVTRGGDWNKTAASFPTVTKRGNHFYSGDPSYRIGFRLARSL